MPSRLALVCTLVFGVTIAYAERRPVAVVDLAGDAATEKLAKDLNPVLQQHPDLRPISDPQIVPELFGPFVDDDTTNISNAQNAKVTAEERLARFEFQLAQESASNGLRDLEKVMPSSNALALYAQLSFVRGQALLGVPARKTEAPTAFALAHRLDPTFVPDPARYLPDVVRAFESAKKAWTGKGTLAVGGSGRVWIDGKDSGVSPIEVEVDAGPHLVWLTGPDRKTTGVPVTVAAGKKNTLAIKDDPADVFLKVRRARAQLRNAPDPAARAAAMRLLAELVGVRDAVLLTSANNKIIVQTWNAGTRDQTPGFSALRELKNEKPIDLLTPLAPPRKTDEEDPGPPSKKKIVVEERRWYERRSVQAGMIVGALAIAVTAYYIYNSLTDDTVTVDNNTQVDTLSSPLGVRW